MRWLRSFSALQTRIPRQDSRAGLEFTVSGFRLQSAHSFLQKQIHIFGYGAMGFPLTPVWRHIFFLNLSKGGLNTVFQCFFFSGLKYFELYDDSIQCLFFGSSIISYRPKPLSRLEVIIYLLLRSTIRLSTKP